VIFPEEDTLFRNQYDREAGAFFDAGMPGGKWVFLHVREKHIE